MGHKFPSSNSDKFIGYARLVQFQFDVAMESRDVYERVSGSERFPSCIHQSSVRKEDALQWRLRLSPASTSFTSSLTMDDI